MSTRLLNTLIETATDLHSIGILSEGMLVDLKDIQLDQAQEEIVELEGLIRDLVYVVWNHQDCKHNEDIVEVLGNTPAKFINFMD